MGGFSVFSFQFSVFSFQFSVFSFQFSVFSFQFEKRKPIKVGKRFEKGTITPGGGNMNSPG
ncbi:hypothetical protein BWI96_17200 [Siphonobacter sp. SORGH_AS_0500]|nr:hypothetical protein BWI96_17200 [Siphonobacter sp. SORGH_AS_0500]